MQDRYHQAREIMQKFAITTGLTQCALKNKLNTPRCCLWTDAFAVCNYLSIYTQSGEPYFLQQALKLVEQVHSVLGKHRKENGKMSWLSGLNQQQGLMHPTIAGLRIGKPYPERTSNQSESHILECNRDGQYFHYLTKWMHALYSLAQLSNNADCHRWALELAKTAFNAFSHEEVASGKKQLYFKMNTTLTVPLISSVGQHQALDGLYTFIQLQVASKQFSEIPPELSLHNEIDQLINICTQQSWACNDALLIGDLLISAYKIVGIIQLNQPQYMATLIELLNDIEQSLRNFVAIKPLSQPGEDRMPFRELGLAIGLQVLPRMQQIMKLPAVNYAQSKSFEKLLTQLGTFVPLHREIERFWLQPAHQELNSWIQDIDMNNVMLATSMLPDRYIEI